MKIRLYQVDAFADRLFEGNPAAVCPLDAWLEDGLLQAIAAENNLSETAFYVPDGDGFALRWFTPVVEVDLCGHATLATAHVILNLRGHPEPSVAFATRSGTITVRRDSNLLAMDFPAVPAEPCAMPDRLVDGLGRRPDEILAAHDYVAVFGDEDTVRSLTPDFAALQALDRRGVIVTAPGREADFVSRFFAPKFGIPEDPVTGSAHCTLTPYWAARLGKTDLHAHQVSKRGGRIECRNSGDRVILRGGAVTYLEGEIQCDV